MIICVYAPFDSDLVNHKMNGWLYRMLVKNCAFISIDKPIDKLIDKLLKNFVI
jgi:hypothetical protein